MSQIVEKPSEIDGVVYENLTLLMKTLQKGATLKLISGKKPSDGAGADAEQPQLACPQFPLHPLSLLSDFLSLLQQLFFSLWSLDISFLQALFPLHAIVSPGIKKRPNKSKSIKWCFLITFGNRYKDNQMTQVVH